METLVVIEKSGRAKDGTSNVTLLVAEKHSGDIRHIGPFAYALVCDIEKGDTFTWDGSDIHTLKLVGAGQLDIPVDKDASDLEIIRLASPDIPAPIDWEREYANILDLREKAISYIIKSGSQMFAEEFYSRQDSAYLIKEAAKVQKAIAGGIAQ